MSHHTRAKAREKIAREKNSGGAAGGHIRQAQCKGAAQQCEPGYRTVPGELTT